MDVFQFNQMDIDEKAQYTWNNGHRIECFSIRATSFILYRTPDFYVEFEFKNECVSDIRAFDQGEQLEKYLDQIDLAALWN